MSEKVINAVSVLNEFCQRGKISSYSFQEVGMTGPCHQPIFEMEVIATRKQRIFKATAKAGNKKAAKGLAAIAVLKKMGFELDVLEIEIMPAPKKRPNEETAVSYLNRMAQQGGFAMPVYIDGGNQGQAHNPLFEMAVEFRGKKAIGFGPSKKEAKEVAAMVLKDQL